MKGDNRTGKLSGELYHSRKDSKIENYFPAKVLESYFKP